MTDKAMPRENLALKRAIYGLSDETVAVLLNMRVQKLHRILSGRGRVSQTLLDRLMYEAVRSLGLRFAMQRLNGDTDSDAVAQLRAQLMAFATEKK